MSISIKTLGAVCALAVGFGAATAPSVAQAGFLDQLFGGGDPQPAPQAPSYDYAPPQVFFPEQAVPRHAKKKVVADDKPHLQKPTDLMHDATLQAGDAVMMKGGIVVYTGDDGARRHSKDDFAQIDEVDGLSKPERKALVAMDTSLHEPLGGTASPDTISSGRSAAVASPIVAGRKIVDARGKTVRYVGP